MNLQVSYKSEENQCGKIRVCEEDTKNAESVWDLKMVLQEKLQVPACDQRLFYYNRLLGNNKSIKDLYLRSGDELYLEYPAAGDLKDISRFVVLQKEFLEEMERLGFLTPHSENILLTEESLDSNSWLNYSAHVLQLVHTMEHVGFSRFIPWKSLRSQANRNFFVQTGGFEDFMKILRFSDKIFLVPGSGNINHEPVTYLEWIYSQLQLQLKCLSLLWNFSETAANRLLLLQSGGLTDVMNALSKDYPQSLSPIADELETDVELFCSAIHEAAIGCLVQYVELPEPREIVVNNEAAMNKMIFMSDLSQGYSTYSSQIAANTLACCSASSSTSETIAKNGLHCLVIPLLQDGENREDLAITYFSCIFLGQIRACSRAPLTDEERNQIDDILQDFVEHNIPKDIADFEEEHSYVWITMLPFVNLAFAGGPPGTGPAVEGPVISNHCVDGPPPVQLGHEAQRTQLVIQHGVAHACNRVLVSDAAVRAVHVVQGAADGQSDEQPAVRSRDRHAPLGATPTMWPGSAAAQRFGVFTVLNLLHSAENAKIMERENLVGFLSCLVWYLPEQVKDELSQCLHKVFGPPKVPPLRVLSKAMLARMHGFFYAVNL